MQKGGFFTFVMSKATPGKEMDEMGDFIRGENPSREEYEMSVACEEAYMNICMHAYGEGKGPCLVRVFKGKQKITVVFVDCGKRYNPSKGALPVFDKERVGGHGLRIMREYSKMVYLRMWGINLLKLERREKT